MDDVEYNGVVDERNKRKVKKKRNKAFPYKRFGKDRSEVKE